MRHFGETLRVQREAAGLSLEAAAVSAGMTKQGLSVWELSPLPPRSIRFAVGLANAYGVDLETFAAAARPDAVGNQRQDAAVTGSAVV